MNELTLTGVATMTSLELVAVINELRQAGKPELRHDNFITKIESHPGIDAPKFLGTQKYGNGNTRKVYTLPKRECDLMVMSESLAVQARVYDRMAALEAAVALMLPVALPNFADPVAAARAWADATEAKQVLAVQILADAPKVAFAEAIRSIDGVCHIEKIAKTLGFGRNKFFKRLRDDAVLMRSNLPYQKYIDRQYFTVIEQEPFTDKDGIKHPTFTAMVTGAGQVFLARKYSPLAAA